MKRPSGADNLIENGDIESGEQDVFRLNYGPPIEVFRGNPVAGDQDHDGEYCLVIREGGQGSANHGLVNQNLVVDPRRTYRFSLRYHTTAPFYGGLGGYGQSDGGNVQRADGSVFEWNLRCEGPTAGWTEASLTIGPPGSDADQHWPPETTRTTMRFAFFNLPVGGTIYLDDLEVVEVPPSDATPR